MALLQPSSHFRSYFSTYIGLSQAEHRVFKSATSPDTKGNGGRPSQPTVLTRAVTSAWDLRVTGANVVLETLRTGTRGKSRLSVKTARESKRVTPERSQEALKSERVPRKVQQCWSLHPTAPLRSASAAPLLPLPRPKPLASSNSLKTLHSKASPSPIRHRRTRKVIQTTVMKPSNAQPSQESPTKRLYKRLVQRTSEQIAREQLQGWT